MPAGRILVRHDEQFLTPDRWEKFHLTVRATREFCAVLQDDFEHAVNLAAATQYAAATESRAMIRCFGSLIDGLSRGMREIAIATCELFGGKLNPFLQEKVHERATSTHQRIYNSYRLIAEFLPNSPLSSLPDHWWADLHRAIEIRNRVVHPASAKDLNVSQDETIATVGVAEGICDDFAKFTVWLAAKEQKLAWEHMVERRRLTPKIGRNEKCPCGSYRKYKNCCAAAQHAA